MRFLAIAALALAGCAADPWPGVYDGESVTDGQSCDGATPGTTDRRSITVKIERGRSGLFISGTCLVYLDELSDESARVRPAECDAALADGTPVHYEIVEGRAGLRGAHLRLEYSASVTTPDGCVTALSTFDGHRR